MIGSDRGWRMSNGGVWLPNVFHNVEMGFCCCTPSQTFVCQDPLLDPVADYIQIDFDGATCGLYTFPAGSFVVPYYADSQWGDRVYYPEGNTIEGSVGAFVTCGNPDGQGDTLLLQAGISSGSGTYLHVQYQSARFSGPLDATNFSLTCDMVWWATCDPSVYPATVTVSSVS